MKKIFGILFIFSFVCGYSQVFDFPHRIYSLETKFLKILYTEESSESALLLFQKGDGIYEKCAALTGRKKNTKIPVILTSDEKILNGYYTPYPGTRIVINDTIPGSGELLVFNDTLLGVFTHELTHALGAENRDSFFGFLSAVFGDYVIPSYGFNLPLFLVEGLAVYGETSVLSGFYGFPQGRLNDSSYGEKLVLAKSLGDFPSWQEVSGAGNEYYDGSLPYIYGAGFVEYLAENYGENKITTLLENSSSFNFLFTDGVFKKTFGLSIDVLWENFRNSITAVEFCKNSFIQDSGTGLSGKGLDFAVTAADCYYGEKEGVGRVAVYDSVSGRVFSYVFSGENSFTEEQPCVYGIEKLKPVFSFRASSVKLSFSHDGKYLAVSGCLSSGNGYKWVTKFFSFEDFRFLNLEIPDSLEAAFIPENNREPEGEYKLVCLSSRTEDYPTLNFFDVRLAGRNSCFSKTSSLFLENTDGVKIQPANITPVINKGILFIGHIGSHRKLFALKGDSLFEVLTGYETETSGGKILPLSITNSVLPKGERILCLGFETGNGVPVWGFLNPGGNTAGLSFDYFPGGINFPLMVGTDFFYTSISDKRRIFSFAKISEKDTGSLQEYKIFTGQEILLPGEIESRNFRFPIPGSEKYSCFSGFYPAFVLPGLNLGPFSSANPWYSVVTPGIHYHAGHPGEYWNLSFFGGYNPYYNFPVFNLDFWFGWNDFPLEIILDHKIKGISGNEGRKELSVSWNLPYSFSIFGPKGSTGSVNLQFFNNYTFMIDSETKFGSEIEISSENVVKYSLLLSGIMLGLIVFICGIMFGISSYFGVQANNKQAEITKLQSEISALENKIKAGIITLIKQISEKNKTGINFYDSLSSDIPSHVWLNYYYNKDGDSVAIEGYSLEINDIYEYYKSLKILAPKSNILLNELEVFSDENNEADIDSMAMNDVEQKQQVFKFVISNVEYVKTFNESGNKKSPEEMKASQKGKPAAKKPAKASKAAKIPLVPDIEINLKEIK